MSAPVRLDDLLDALEWVSAGEAVGGDCEAYVSKATGAVHWVGERIDEEPPADIENESLYVALPHKRDFELGRSLALRFVAEHLPGSYDLVHDYFRKRGAYSRLKALLERAGQLEAWHQHEQQAIEEALREWSEENGLTLDR